ncbi:MAG: cyclic nucleotide-binding domain-containing protein, partial [Deltaproteobacteria bacterium]|nr:cyclic nucleotide-binding domain-containing protein [Deltaproteobacteria bacterium]
GLWVLSDGEVVLREDGRILSYIVAPALLGLKELLTATPYPTTGQAMTACQVTFIGKEELAPLLARPPLSDLIGAS